MSVYECPNCENECLTGIAPGQRVICWCCDNEFEVPEPIGSIITDGPGRPKGAYRHEETLRQIARQQRLRADGAEEELQLCRLLLDSYGFHQVGIHNGIIAMQNKIKSLEEKP